MKERNGWWVTAISLGMVAYGALSLWSGWHAVRVAEWSGGWQGPVAAVSYYSRAVASLVYPSLLPALIGVVGVLGVVRALMYQPEGAVLSDRGPLLEPYIRAWRKFRSSKWLLWICGTTVVLTIPDHLLSLVLQYLNRSAVMGNASGAASQASLWTYLQGLWIDMPHWVSDVLTRFVPRVARVGAGPILDIAVVAFVIWMLFRLPRLAREPELAAKTAFFRLCLVLLLVACASAAVIASLREYRFWAMLTAVPHNAAASSGGVRVMSRYEPIYGHVVDVVIQTLVCGILMGGVLGSLARLRKGAHEVKATFLGDAVRYFEPMAAIYLVLWLLVGMLPLLIDAAGLTFLSLLPFGLLPILLIYAPWGVVTQGLGFRGAVKHSLWVWRSSLRRTLLLIATGAFFLALANGLVRVLVICSYNWSEIAVSPLLAIIAIGTNIITLLAVWEFYQANVTAPESSSLPESSPSP
jgi:hypothetical protein